MPDAGGACSGYLVSEGDFRLLLDCGTGVFAKLRMFCEPNDVDTILITHMHADHVADLLPFGHALSFPLRHLAHRPRLLVPPGGAQRIQEISEVFGIGYQLEQAFAVEEYEPASVLTVGPLETRFQEVPHYIRTWACELRTPIGRRFTFGADCAPNEALPAFAAHSDLLILEATEGTSVQPADDDGIRGHMTAQEAGEMARAAQARRLVITHFSDQLDPEAVRAAAAVSFGADVDLAHGGAVYVV